MNILAEITKCYIHKIRLKYVLKCEATQRVRLCDSHDRSPPGYSVNGIFSGKSTSGVAISF